MTELSIRSYAAEDEQAVVQLWHDAGLVRPWNDPHADILRKLSVQADLFLIGEFEGQIVASAMAGYDGHRGWINYLAVSPGSRGCGFGQTIMAEAESRLLSMGCPKINVQIRHDNEAAIKFYASIGFSTDAAHSMGKRLIEDN